MILSRSGITPLWFGVFGTVDTQTLSFRAGDNELILTATPTAVSWSWWEATHSTWVSLAVAR